MGASTFMPEARFEAGCCNAPAGQMGVELGFLIGKGVLASKC